MIRVLHVLGGLDRGGAETMVMNLYRCIDRSTIQFDFIIHTPTKRAYYDEIIAMGGRIYHFPAFNGTNMFHLRDLWNEFFLNHPEYKVLHSHVRSYASLYLPIAKKYGVKTIIHSHSTSNGKGITSFVKRIMQYPLRYQADYLMACSNDAGRWLYGAKACQKTNYFFLPNAIDVEKYRFSQTDATLYRKMLGLEGKFVIGHVGRFHEAKNHIFLLDVFAKICDSQSDAMLLLVGDGELRDVIITRIKSLSLEDRVILVGSRSDVPQLLNAMDVFMFPSKWEGLPVTVVEAQASGLPCIISEKITRDVDISFLVKRLPVNDVNEWTKAVFTLPSPSERVDVISEIKKKGFDVKDTAARVTKFYCSIGGNND